MKTVTAMVVDDSAVARELLVATLNSDPRIKVIAAVDSGEAAVRLAERLAPDVISMDVRLPGMSGIEATRRIMEVCPTPVVVVAGDLSRSSTANAMEALSAGALLVVEKPAVESVAAYQAMAKRLCDQFVSLSLLKLVRQRFNNNPPPRLRSRIATPSAPVPETPISVVGIAASTGGPPAIERILAGIGDGFAAPILVVQHMGAGFLPGFAEWLATTTGRDVRLADDGETTVAGRAYVGPGGAHLTWCEGTIRLKRTEADNGHVPSGDALFASLAAAGPRAVGLLLTGMGDDGAKGLYALRRSGGVTICQDRATSAVYGMPAAARALGAASEELPLDLIAPRLLRLVQTSAGERQRRAAR